MWVLVNAKLISRQQDNLDPQIQATILSESMKLYMTHIINDPTPGTTTPSGAPQGNLPSQAQIQFAKDLGCTNPEGYSKSSLSKWIEEHK